MRFFTFFWQSHDCSNNKARSQQFSIIFDPFFSFSFFFFKQTETEQNSFKLFYFLPFFLSSYLKLPAIEMCNTHSSKRMKERKRDNLGKRRRKGGGGGEDHLNGIWNVLSIGSRVTFIFSFVRPQATFKKGFTLRWECDCEPIGYQLGLPK